MHIPDKAILEATKAIYRKHGEPVNEESIKRAATALEYGAPLVIAEFLRGVISGMPAGSIFSARLIEQSINVLEEPYKETPDA